MSDPVLKTIAVDDVRPHPDNPRIEPRQDVIDSIAAQIEGSGVDVGNALKVRQVGDGFQILGGHHRRLAAQQAGIAEVPAWIYDVDDDTAFMMLVTDNTHGELTPLEIGMHALKAVPPGEGGRGKTGGLREYARQLGRADPPIIRARNAAEVITETATQGSGLTDLGVKHLAAIHAAPRDYWQDLVTRLAREGWTVAETTAAVNRIEAEAEAERERQRRADQDRADKLAFLKREASDYTARYESGEFASIDIAYATWESDNREEADRRAREKARKEAREREHREAIDRAARQLSAALTTWHILWEVAGGHTAQRDEIVAALNDQDRKRFLQIEKETTWPATMI